MQRDPFFDNAKFLLIACIILGHVIEPIENFSNTVQIIYTILYTFHIPLFVFISGIFSKAELSLKNIGNLTLSILLPYLLYQVFFSLFIWIGSGLKDFNISLLFPHNIAWYLLSLYTWRLLLIALQKIPLLILLVISMLVALLVGYSDSIDRFLSLSRTIVLFPFFLLGYFCKDKISWIKSRALPMYIPLIIFCIVFVLSIYFTPQSSHWLFHDSPYSQMDAPFFHPLYRLLIFSITTTVGISFLRFVPTTQIFFSNYGRYSLYSFMLHWIIIRTLTTIDLYPKSINLISLICIYVPICIILTLLLSSKPVRILAMPLAEPTKIVQKIKGIKQ